LRHIQNVNDVIPVFSDLPSLYIHPDRQSEWMSELPDDITKSMNDCPRLQHRLSSLIHKRYCLEPYRPQLEGADVSIAILSHAHLVQLIKIAGAVWHGRSLMRLITKVDLVEIHRAIGESGYQIAISQAAIFPAPDNPETDLERPSEACLERDGVLCFRAWLAMLPKSISARILLKFPTPFFATSIPPNFLRHGPSIISAVGKELTNHAA